MRVGLFLLLLVSPAAALVIDDPAGDATVYVMGVAQPPDGGVAEADLLQLEVTERERFVRFALRSAEIPEEPHFEARINFTYDGMPHALLMKDVTNRYARFIPPGYPGAQDLAMWVEDGRRIVDVPKSILFDAQGAAGRIGTALEIVGGHALGPHIIGGDLYAIDLLDGSGSLVLASGAMVPKDVAISSPAPERVSNGAATVYTFEVVLSSLVDAPVQVQLGATDAPGTWDVRFPVDIVSLGPRENRTIPVLVQVPFAHQHGVFEAVTIEVRGLQSGVLLSALDLGVDYTAVPQPAGHHDTLWFHTAPDRRASPNPDGLLYFSTIEEIDEPAADVGAMCYREGTQTEYHWLARFQTPVFIGLDFRPGEVVDLFVPLVAPVDIANVGLTVRLELQGVPLASHDSSIALAAGRNELALQLSLADWLDDVAPHPNRAMDLRFIARSDDPSLFACREAGIQWAPGAMMVLPLDEYHDPAPTVAADVLTGEALPAQVAPGSRLAIEHAIRAEPDERLELRVFGIGAEFARMAPAIVTVDGQGAATATLVVEVPEDAAAGQPFDLIVEAVGTQSVGLHRSAFVVAPAADLVQDDEPPAQTPPGNDAPLPWLGTLVLLALARRR